jgi:hypothetical protein
MSTLKSINVVHPSGTVNNITNDASGNVAVGNNLAVTGTLTASGTSVYGLVQGTAQASTSGTGIDFTGIPSWVKRITVMFNGVSTNALTNAAIQMQVGSTTLTATGYNSVITVTATSSYTATYTPSFLVTQYQAAGTLVYGSAVLTNISGNTWIMAGQVYMTTNTSAVSSTAVFTGQIALSGVLNRVYIFAATDTFDAGSINILYE